MKSVTSRTLSFLLVAQLLSAEAFSGILEKGMHVARLRKEFEKASSVPIQLKAKSEYICGFYKALPNDIKEESTQTLFVEGNYIGLLSFIFNKDATTVFQVAPWDTYTLTTVCVTTDSEEEYSRPCENQIFVRGSEDGQSLYLELATPRSIVPKETEESYISSTVDPSMLAISYGACKLFTPPLPELPISKTWPLGILSLFQPEPPKSKEVAAKVVTTSTEEAPPKPAAGEVLSSQSLALFVTQPLTRGISTGSGTGRKPVELEILHRDSGASDSDQPTSHNSSFITMGDTSPRQIEEPLDLKLSSESPGDSSRETSPSPHDKNIQQARKDHFKKISARAKKGDPVAIDVLDLFNAMKINPEVLDLHTLRIYCNSDSSALTAKQLNSVGLLYDRGWGGSADKKLAEEYFLASANKGDRVAQFNVGDTYYGKDNLELAKKYFLLSAQQDYPLAQYSAAILLYNDGKLEEAREWLRKAATSPTYYLAQLEYALMLISGEGSTSSRETDKPLARHLEQAREILTQVSLVPEFDEKRKIAKAFKDLAAQEKALKSAAAAAKRDRVVSESEDSDLEQSQGSGSKKRAASLGASTQGPSAGSSPSTQGKKKRKIVTDSD